MNMYKSHKRAGFNSSSSDDTKSTQRKRRAKVEADPEYRPTGRRRLKKAAADEARNADKALSVAVAACARLFGSLGKGFN